MRLEDYFDFLSPDEIRVKGHRIGIETILYQYVYRDRTAEEIAADYDTVTLEEIYATILYYLHNRDTVSKYLAEWLEHCRLTREQQRGQNADLMQRMARLKAEREAGQAV
jgi:uncharacterized protein (DUF433 family)